MAKKSEKRPAGCFGAVFRTLKMALGIVIVFGLCIHGSLYYHDKNAHNARTKNQVKESTEKTEGVEPAIPGGETFEEFSARNLKEVDRELANKLIDPTRELLTRLENAEKQLPELKKVLQEAEDSGRLVRDNRLRYGVETYLVDSWKEKKGYTFPVSRSELESKRAKFEAAVGRVKSGSPLDDDPATIIEVYEFAGKLMRLDREKGLFVILRAATGPEEDMREFRELYDRVLRPR